MVNRERTDQNSKDIYNNDIFSAFAERTVKRLWVLIILLVVYCGVMTYLYVDTLLAYETQYATVEVDTGEGDAVVAGIGDVYYGENTGDDQAPRP